MSLDVTISVNGQVIDRITIRRTYPKTAPDRIRTGTMARYVVVGSKGVTRIAWPWRPEQALTLEPVTAGRS